MSVFRRCLLFTWGVLGCTPAEPSDTPDALRVGDSAAPAPPGVGEHMCGVSPDQRFCRATALCILDPEFLPECLECESVTGPVCDYEGAIELGGREGPRAEIAGVSRRTR